MLKRNSCGIRITLTAIVVLVCVGSVPARAGDPNQPPEITQHPTSQAVCEGENVTFTVVATGEELSYQWRKNGQEITDATSDTLNLEAVTTADTGDYDVVVSNPHGSVTSDAATLSVDTGPVITQDPADQTVCQGEDVSLTVVATTLVGELTYQWYKEDEPIDGAASAALELCAVTTADSGDYNVNVTSPCGSATSAVATLIVDEGPVIVEHPTNATVCEGAAHTLSATVANQATTYEDTIGTTGSSGSGARMRGNYYRVDTAITLTRIEQYLNITTSGQIVFFAYEADSYTGSYVLIAEDTVADSGTGVGYYSSNPLAVVLREDKYYLIGAAWPDVHTYYWNYIHGAKSFGASLAGFAANWADPLPSPAPFNPGDAAYMQRLTTSDLTLTYQWRKDDEDIPGAAGPEYTIDAMSLVDEGEYYVVINSDCGNATSDIATITLHINVTITQQPSSQAVCLGDEAVFSVVAEGGALTYQWRKDSEDIEDATNDTYTVIADDPNAAGTYDVIVSNGCPLTSAAATLTIVETAPSISGHPADVAGCQGQPATFAVVATGGSLQYQWQKDGQDIADATNAYYTISAVDPNDAGQYGVVVGNPCGQETSTSATLTVDETLSIIAQPQDEKLCIGDEYMLIVVTAGTNVSYQWRKDGEDIVDATGNTYTISDADPNDAGDYDVAVSNNCGEIISDAAEVSVVSDMVILEQPKDQWVCPGDPLTISVKLDFAGFSNDIDTIGEADESYSGEDKLRGNSYEVTQTATLTLIEHYLNITQSGPLVFFVYESEVNEQGPYTLILEDTVEDPGTGLGFFASNPIEVRLEAGRYYIIGAGWREPHTYYRDEGTHPWPTAFGQTVHGFSTFYQGWLPYEPTPTSSLVWHQRLTTVSTVDFCQWRKDGVDIPDAVEDTYSVAAADATDAGEYEVEITNACGTVLSNPAGVSVIRISQTPLEQPRVPIQENADVPPDPTQTE